MKVTADDVFEQFEAGEVHSIGSLHRRFPAVDRRSIQRRIKDLLDANRIMVKGRGPARKYQLPVPVQPRQRPTYIPGRHVEPDRERTGRKPRPHFVYLIDDGDFAKIGITSEPKVRLTNLRNANPRIENYESMYEVHALDDARAIEKLIHKHLQDHRVRGEWFHRAAAFEVYYRFCPKVQGPRMRSVDEG